MLKLRLLAVVLLGVCLSGAALAQPKLGRSATPEEIAKQDISIGPDGATLPPGSGSVTDGLAVYEARCKSCHGDKGDGGRMDRLTGGIGSLVTDRPVGIRCLERGCHGDRLASRLQFDGELAGTGGPASVGRARRQASATPAMHTL